MGNAAKDKGPGDQLDIKVGKLHGPEDKDKHVEQYRQLKLVADTVIDLTDTVGPGIVMQPNT